MRQCTLFDFENRNITNLDHVMNNWFNRLCPGYDVDETSEYKVRNSKHNKTERNSFQLEITECQLEQGCITEKLDIKWLMQNLYFSVYTVEQTLDVIKVQSGAHATPLYQRDKFHSEF